MDRELSSELLRQQRQALWLVVVASLLINLLVFAGSIYMMLVYDSVLPSRSLPTLFGLFAMLALVYFLQGALELIRSEALLTIANRVHHALFAPVHRAAVTRTLQIGRPDIGGQLLRDLDQVHSFLVGAGPIALIDLPWVLLFLIVLTSLHWALGLTALLGTLILVALAWWTDRRSAAGTQEFVALAGQRNSANQTELRFAETARAMGMEDRLLERSRTWDRRYLLNQAFLNRTVTRLGGAGRLFRLFLQSIMLTVGALLVIDGRASGGIILAASVLSGRALAPVDMLLANARTLSAARDGWARIAEALRRTHEVETRSIALPAPHRELTARDLWVVPPGSQTAVVTGVTLRLEAGQALAIIGSSAAGKSSLAKALLGVWPAARGEIRLDGATLDQWDRRVLGTSLGYVPQEIDLLEGTVAQIINRFEPDAASERVVAAGRQAGLHDLILTLPQGYETLIGPGQVELSAGQKQRLALARALYGEPFLLVLDEPNSNLDAAGDAALAQAVEAVRRRGGIVIMVTHRPATLGPITHVAVLADGRLIDFGPRDEVLKRNRQVQPQFIDGRRSTAPGKQKDQAE